jgi:hypothetical protein
MLQQKMLSVLVLTRVLRVQVQRVRPAEPARVQRVQQAGVLELVLELTQALVQLGR